MYIQVSEEKCVSEHGLTLLSEMLDQHGATEIGEEIAELYDVHDIRTIRDILTKRLEELEAEKDE